MKKLVILAGALIVAMTACDKTENALDAQQGGSIISFQPLAAVQTKSAPITKYESTTGDFNVYAWYQATATSETFNPIKEYTLYMENVTCKFADAGDLDTGEGSNTWKPASTYYWPKNGKLTFSAYYPTDVENVTVDAKKGITITGYTITDATNQVDLLFSDRAYDKVSTTQSDVVKEYDGVDIVFNHALSAASFVVKTSAEYVENAIKLRKIEIVDALNKGTFAENCNNGYNDESNKPAWTPTNDKATYTVYSNEGEPVTQTGWQAGADCILLPQTFSESLAIKVTYAIKYGTSNYLEQTATFPLKKTQSASGAINAWEMGKWYKYTFTFTLDEIYFAPSVDEWESVTMNPLNVIK